MMLTHLLFVNRFYIMKLEKRSLKFSTITHHAKVTQCLGSIGGGVWYLGVAKPSIVETKENAGSDAMQSKCGHFYVPPAVDKVQVFRISGSKFIKLNIGTWHAGPLFKPETMDFYNLELSDTNVSLFLFSSNFLCIFFSHLLWMFVCFSLFL